MIKLLHATCMMKRAVGERIHVHHAKKRSTTLRAPAVGRKRARLTGDDDDDDDHRSARALSDLPDELRATLSTAGGGERARRRRRGPSPAAVLPRRRRRRQRNDDDDEGGGRDLALKGALGSARPRPARVACRALARASN